MAKRQALQDLQARIARLLEQASAQPALSVSWLGVRIGALRVLLPLKQSGEIYPMGAVQPLPYAKPWFLGVTSLRGAIFGVVDLSPFLGAPAQPINSGHQAGQRLIAFNEAFGLNVALSVQGLEGLRGREAFERSEPPPAGSPVYYGSVFIDKQNNRWQEVSLQQLAQCADFLNVAVEVAAAPATV